METRQQVHILVQDWAMLESSFPTTGHSRVLTPQWSSRFIPLFLSVSREALTDVKSTPPLPLPVAVCPQKSKQPPEKTTIKLILKQACGQDCLTAPCAFKVSMIHWILQFTLRIASSCVLHRCTSQEIHRLKLCFCYGLHVLDVVLYNKMSMVSTQKNPHKG